MPGILLVIKQLTVVGMFTSCDISVEEIVCVQILFLILDVKISSWAKKNDMVVRWNFSKDMFFLEQ